MLDATQASYAYGQGVGAKEWKHAQGHSDQGDRPTFEIGSLGESLNVLHLNMAAAQGYFTFI